MPQITNSEKVLTVSSLADLPKAAAGFVTFLQQNNTISTVLFEGEMGAGKTTFIKAICAELGVSDPVSSPTFSIVNEYEGRNGQRIYHFDFYRIEDEREALNIGFYDYLDSGNLCLIEWPSKVENLLPEHNLLVEITSTEEGDRTITLKLT
jgi:tRNA threonylcarbamoyladenosine biosynthesis protein TsaE